MNPDFCIKYDGGDASKHSIDMRLLGASLQGADKITSDGLILLIQGRVPKRRECAPVAVKVREPVEGSYELWAFWEAVKGMLPLGVPGATDVVSGFISEWWSAVIAKFSGKPDVAEKALDALVSMNESHLRARDLSEARAHEERMAFLDVLRSTLAMQGSAVEQFASPVGPSVESVTITPVGAASALLTSEDADAIRDNLKLEWRPIDEIRLKTDGFRFHTGGLSVENPEREGYLMARVHDPKFDEDENAYTEAAQRRSEIVVLGRKGYKGESLSAIEILEFLREIAP